MPEENYFEVQQVSMKRYTFAIAGMIIIVAILVLIGWQFDIEFFRRPIPGLVAMNPVSALLFILSCVSLLLQQKAKRENEGLYFIAQVLAVIILLGGVFRLFAVVAGFDIGIDQWLFTEKLFADLKGNLSNHMAPNTAFNFVISGIALLFLDRTINQKYVPSHYFSLLTFFIALLSFIGYLYKVNVFYNVLSYFPMAIHTAICFLLLSMGILFTHSDKGFMADFTTRYSGGLLGRLLLPSCIAVPVLLGYLRLFLHWKYPVSVEFGVAILVTSIIVVFFILVWYVTVALNKKDRLRKNAEEKLASLHKELEEIVKIRTEELQKSLKEVIDYKYALDQSSIIAVTDHKGIIRHVNENFCKISKYSREELIGQDHRIINSGHHPKEFIRDLWNTITSGSIWKGELKNKAKDGTFYWVATTIVPFLDNIGKPYKYLAIRADITERKQQTTELQRSLKEVIDYKYALDESCILAVTDQKGIIRHVNDNFCKISKYSKKELIGQDHRIINSGYHPQEFIRDLWVTIANGKIWNGELKNKAKDGTFYWVATTIVPFIDEAGKPYKYLAIRADITERKKIEQLLEQSEQRFRGLIENSHDAITLVDENTRVFYQSPSVERMTGISLEERLINPGIKYTHPDDLEMIKELYVKVKNSPGISFPFKSRMLHKNGKYIWIEGITTNLLHDESVRAIVSNFRNVTYRVVTEEKIKKNTLELERSNKELEQFAYIASHDLQEPLRMVGSYVQLLERRYKGRLDDDANEFINYAVDGVNRMKQLINDLLSFSRIHKSGDVSHVDLSKILNTVLSNLAVSILESDAQINVGDMPAINAEPTQMLQLFQNLISNAIKFRVEGQVPVINVDSEKQDEWWLFSVEDNGIGIDEQYAEQVFVIFKQLNGKSRYSGTGIGLAIARKIVEKHGGRIWFESKPGQGTKFCFTIKSQINETN